jgi:protein-S-isoprenylcysteine O-methyltransferase Ste14
MKNYNVLNAFFLSNPFYRGMAEKIILIGTGICGLVLSWKTFSIFPLSNILGGILVLLAYAFHRWTEKDHKQAHKESQDIEIIVTTGVYSKIRHPLYLSLIAMNIGIALAFGVMMTFALALLTIIHWVLTALKEEEALMKQFPVEYPRYKQRVRWLMIPGVF